MDEDGLDRHIQFQFHLAGKYRMHNSHYDNRPSRSRNGPLCSLYRKLSQYDHILHLVLKGLLTIFELQG